ncbi:MAG: transcriptional regulator, TetR family [Thermoleophilia bacterium]|jgi:AcrR family transcriptional regulator|nr:transcriptional regulator, TetR family [Thermoleophilia bacterium]
MGLPQRAPRADATRNRAQLLAAARELLAVRGLDFTVGEIARAAGVGKGTAFRHFPTKGVLIDAVLEQRIQEVGVDVRRFLEEEDPRIAFEAFAEYAVRQFVRDRALLQAMCEARDANSTVEACRRDVDVVVAQVLARAQAAGAVRADLDVHDLSRLLLGVALGEPTDGSATGEGAWRRPLAVVLDGLRSTGSTALPR